MIPSPDGERLFIGDGGLETTMIFEEGLELPEFASFVLLRDAAGRAALRRYYDSYLEIAKRHDLGFVLDTPTWRASSDWGERLGYSAEELAESNREAVAFVAEVREAWQAPGAPIAICGALGPRGDAYSGESEMTPAEAAAYHSEQIGVFASTAAEMVAAYTLPYAAEGTGIVAAAVAAGLPVSISFTVETDGRLPSGQALGEAIEEVDAETGSAAAYFMVNCAHPTHFAGTLESGGPWLRRLGGIRANASPKSHAELDEAEELDSGDPVELGELYRQLKPHLPGARVLGGCCGTDSRHVAEIAERWTAAA